MPRAQNDQKVKAREMFDQGRTLVEIASKLGISEGTIRSWKSRDGWGKKAPPEEKKTNATLQKTLQKNCNVAINVAKTVATLQTKEKKKRGAPAGNKNAVGNKGGPPKGSKNASGNKGNPDPGENAVKHGGYRALYMDAYDDDEKALFEELPEDQEIILMDTIRAYTVQERQIMQAIKKITSEDYLIERTLSRTKRQFRNEADREEYERRIREKIEAGERLPGDVETEMEHQEARIGPTFSRLQQDLANVRAKKAAVSAQLNNIRKDHNESSGNMDFAKAWADRIRELDAAGGDDDD